MRKFLMILLGFVFITAVPCGAMMVLEPSGSLLALDLRWLKGTVFENYAVPGAILMFTGGIHFIAWIVVKKSKTSSLWWAVVAGVMMIGYEVVQIIMLQMTYWVQGVYILTGFFTVLASLQLKQKALL